MRFPNFYISVLLLFFAYSGCIEEFNPSRAGYENLLVVEAFLTNAEEPFTVRLSRSIPIDTTGFVPEMFANVTLLSGSNESYDLNEVTPGVYQTVNVLNPTVGETYRIEIRTTTGGHYSSGDVVMRDTPPIDSITYAYQERPAEGTTGVQIYVNTHDPANNTWYYRWEWQEDWTFFTRYYSNFYWSNGQVLQQTENINQCWLNDRSKSIHINSTQGLSQDIVSKYPLRYVSNQSDRLINRYSILVRQYSLSEQSYQYLKELEKVTENLGTLFDPQPAFVQGNIRNINDPAENVIGYFDAAASREQRIFITRSEVPGISVPNYYTFCSDSMVSFNQIAEMAMFGYVLFAETINQFGGTAYLMANSNNCVDCRIRGSNVRPDFW